MTPSPEPFIYKGSGVFIFKLIPFLIPQATRHYSISQFVLFIRLAIEGGMLSILSKFPFI